MSNKDEIDSDEGVFSSSDPITLFEAWLKDAEKSEINDPSAVALATVDPDGLPNVRMVLMKEFSKSGFIFYTNFESTKGKELLAAKKAALCFHWKSIRRQVRVRGIVREVTEAQADAYFNSRPKDSQIGAWASKQSEALTGRFELEKAVAKYAAKYALKKVDRPSHWSGFEIQPLEIEFWRSRLSRLHDRQVFKRDDIEGNDWREERLYP